MRPLLLLPLVLLAGCGEQAITAPDSSGSTYASIERQLPRGTTGKGLTVMTRNLYVGTNVDLIAEAPFAQVPFVVASAFADLAITDFAFRATGFVNEIAATHPDVIGLQEVTLIRLQTVGDFLAPDGSIQNPFPNATTTYQDYLPILLDSLAARGLSYKVAGKVQDVDIEVPMFAGMSGGIPQFSDVRLTDFDVALVRSDLTVTGLSTGNYTDYLVQFGFLPVLRGWVSFRTTVDGIEYRIASTHPESGPGAGATVRLAQLTELAELLASETRPTIILGDLNAEPGSAPMLVLNDSGFVDTWDDSRRQATFTCCNADLLDNSEVDLTERLDYILVRDTQPGPGIAGGIHLTRVGVDPAERVEGPLGLLWPSDHAGIVAQLRLPGTRIAQR